MNNNDINVLLDNRNEYINYLETTLITVISEFFFNINLNCESLKQFQKELSLINKWSQNNIDIKMNIIHKNIKDEEATPKFMQKIIKEIISISIKLKMYELDIKTNKFKVLIPNWHDFLYKCCIECSKQFWKKPTLFFKKITSIEKQNNINNIEKITKECIKNALRSYIPLKELINLIDEIDENTNEIEINTQNLSQKYNNNLQQDLSQKSDQESDQNSNENSDENSDENLDENSDANSLENSDANSKENYQLNKDSHQESDQESDQEYDQESDEYQEKSDELIQKSHEKNHEKSQVKYEQFQEKSDQSQVKNYQSQVKSYQFQVKSDQSQEKSEQSQVKYDQSQVKSDQSQVKYEQSQEKSDQSQILKTNFDKEFDNKIIYINNEVEENAFF